MPLTSPEKSIAIELGNALVNVRSIRNALRAYPGGVGLPPDLVFIVHYATQIEESLEGLVDQLPPALHQAVVEAEDRISGPSA